MPKHTANPLFKQKANIRNINKCLQKMGFEIFWIQTSSERLPKASLLPWGTRDSDLRGHKLCQCLLTPPVSRLPDNLCAFPKRFQASWDNIHFEVLEVHSLERQCAQSKRSKRLKTNWEKSLCWRSLDRYASDFIHSIAHRQSLVQSPPQI